MEARGRPRHCGVCGAPLVRPPKGRMPRFCGTACRMAAYRRRRQGISETTPRWDGPQGRLRLSRLQTFEREQEQKARRREQRLAWEAREAERLRRHAQQQAAQDKRAVAEAARRAVADLRARQAAHRLASRPRR